MGLLSTAKLYLHRTTTLDEPTDLYEHEIGLLEGGTLDLRELRGNPTLFMNTASKCGLTPQFAGLQQLYDFYGERGLQVVGTPSGDFAGQEFDDDEEIASFCERNYGVSFTITEKASVRADPHPLWRDLARQRHRMGRDRGQLEHPARGVGCGRRFARAGCTEHLGRSRRHRAGHGRRAEHTGRAVRQ